MPSASTTPHISSSSEKSSPVTEYSHWDISNDVAVVGMACRTAGGICNPDMLWQALMEELDTSGAMPGTRWEPYQGRDPRTTKTLRETTSRGYFVDGIENFDCQFFGISPKEAEQMDPQQRISLEVAWESLENAGIPAKKLSGTDTAVFWGVNSNDYGRLLLEDLPNIDAWMGIGTAYCGVPNRISYHLNLMGPSVAVDAACASSLVAIHYGVKAITGGESKVVIAGGVNVMCGPGLSRVLDKAGAVSAAGNCRSFDDSADGYGRGEGAAAVVLKSLADAERDGDHSLAVVKGSAVAHNGKTNGIMAPNATAQEQVARKALHAAKICPSTVRYVEAHATSTALGDPTELSALSGVYGKGRQTDDPCFVGSIKPNIGHLEAGAGVMGFIKAVLAINNGVLPGQANLQHVNTRINWGDAGLRVMKEKTKWPETDPVRRAGISSYGYGGTVSHAIIEEPPAPPLILGDASNRTPFSRPNILVLSATQERRIAAVAESLGTWMKQQEKPNLEQICKTMAARRNHHDFRAAAVVESVSDALSAIETLQKGSKSPWIAQGRAQNSASRGVVWVFSGHGSQWPNMGKELISNSDFYEATKPLDAIVHEEIGSSPIQWLQDGDFASSDRIQILTYVMQIGITAVLHKKGVYPQAIIGHSVGEIAASVVAGALSAEEGALIVTRRAVLYRQVMGQGAMTLVQRSYGDVQKDLESDADVAAAINSSPSSCVISGTTEAVGAWSSRYSEQEIQTFPVRTDIAFHSPMLHQLKDPLASALRGALWPKYPITKLYSTTFSDPRKQDPRGPKYWVDNMVSPVQLTSAVHAAVEDGYRTFLEVSTHPVVAHSVEESVRSSGCTDHAVIPTLRRERSPEKSIALSVGRLHCQGVEINWERQMPGPWQHGMPTEPWVHRPAWRETTSGTPAMHDADSHDLLGERILVAGTDIVCYKTKLSTETRPFPGSHPVAGTEIIPAACLLNTLLRAHRGSALQNVNLKVPVAFDSPRSVQILLKGEDVAITSQIANNGQSNDSPWITHTTAQCESSTEQENPASTATSGDYQKKPRMKDTFTVDYLRDVGVPAMGFPWQVFEHYGDANEMLARIDTAPDRETVQWNSSSWAPLFDAATSIASTIFFEDPRLRMPAHIERVRVLAEHDAPKIGWIRVHRDNGKGFTCNVDVLDANKTLVAQFISMRFSEIDGTPGVNDGVSQLVHQVAWPPAMPAEEPLPIHQIILVTKNELSKTMYTQELSSSIALITVSAPDELIDLLPRVEPQKGTVVVYIPSQVCSLPKVATATEHFIWELLTIAKHVAKASSSMKIFVQMTKAAKGQTPTALAHASLFGLSRVIADEHPDNWGGLIDEEKPSVPLQAMKYIQGADCILINDGMPRTAKLRALPRETRIQPPSKTTPRPDATYLITGGLGNLGFATADFLADQGARRLVLVSRRRLPPRKSWATVEERDQPIVLRIQELEKKGVHVCVVSIDMSADTAAHDLVQELERLALPPVQGVVHAAGVLEDQLVAETTQDALHRVLAPKVSGALTLNQAFHPRSLDFFILFSSCGHLFGFPGQSAYGSANSFLDTLATHRRNLGDNAVSFLWTSWRGMGLGGDNEVVRAELDNKGITDVTCQDAFQAWKHLLLHDTDHGVVLRARTLDNGEGLPHPILRDIADTNVRRPGQTAAARSGPAAISTPEPEGQLNLDERVRACVADVLHMAPEDVDPSVALADLGMDSVMNAMLRRRLQAMLKINVPPTLLWNHPTTGHMVGWFAGKLGSQ